MFDRYYWYNGTYNKYLISNLYYDKDTGNYKISIQIGKNNKLNIYANSRDEAINIMTDIADMMVKLIKDIEFIEQTNKK